MPDCIYSSEKGTSRYAGEISSDHTRDVVEPVVVDPVHHISCQEHGGKDRRRTGTTQYGLRKGEEVAAKGTGSIRQFTRQESPP